MYFRKIFWLLAGLLAVGCASKQQQLENVAKDWCLTIRASQVIPVYPLTEDVQPGDIFLVQVPVDLQQQLYEKQGFLPLDNHLARLNPTRYQEFYANSFQTGTNALPNYFMQPQTSGSATTTMTSASARNWQKAPQAGFPSYTFSVKSGGGFQGALPLDGVPISLSLLGTDSADGSVTIGKASTYGVDIYSLSADVDSWDQDPNVQQFLASYAPGKGRGKQNYVRVICRVYLTGRLVVSLTDTSSSSLSGSAGAPKSLNLLTPSAGTQPSAATAQDYSNALTNYNTFLSGLMNDTKTSLPGATVSLVSASGRSITTAEDFIDRPLVIGYLAFDRPILAGGRLGAPIPTHALLNGRISAADQGNDPFTATQASRLNMISAINASPKHQELHQYILNLFDPAAAAEYSAKAKTDPNDDRDAFEAVVGKYVPASSSDLENRFDAIVRQTYSDQLNGGSTPPAQ